MGSDPPTTSRPAAAAVAARLGSHFARAPPHAQAADGGRESLAASVVTAARAQQKALYLLQRGVPLPAALVEAIGGHAEAQPSLRAAAGGRPPRVMNAAVLGGGGAQLAPAPPPLTADAVAVARRAVEERVKSRLARAAAELGRPTDKLPESVRLALLIRHKALKLAPRQAALRAAVLAEARTASAAAKEAASPGSVLAEWSRWRRAAPGDLAEPVRPHPPPPVVTAEAQAEVAAAAQAREKGREGGAGAKAAAVLQRPVPPIAGSGSGAAAARRRAAEAARLEAAEAAVKEERAALDARAALVAEANTLLRDAVRPLGGVLAKRRAARVAGARAWHARAAKRAAREVAARVAALKGADYGAYVKLAVAAKDARLTELLDRTDAVVEELKARVPAQRIAAVSAAAGPDGLGGTGGLGGWVDAPPPLAGDDDDAEEAIDPDVDPEAARLLAAQREYYAGVHVIKEKVSTPSMMAGGGRSLRAYQLAGLRFLVSLVNNRVNGILADEMGLGKTVQAIALIAHLAEAKGVHGPHLILAPKAVLPNWAAEFARWAPGLKAVLYDGHPDERRALRAGPLSEAGGGFTALLTHYDLAIRDARYLRPRPWATLIVDEGHRLKNADARLGATLRSFSAGHRLLLTGTPLQNSLGELWALLNFVLPKVFDSASSFDEWFAAPLAGAGAGGPASPGPGGDGPPPLTEEEQLLVITRLHQVLRPFVLRRTKAEVEGELPSKRVVTVRVALSAWQAAWYRQLVERGRVAIGAGGGAGGGAAAGGPRRAGSRFGGALRNIAVQLRKVCLHPYLFLEGLGMGGSAGDDDGGGPGDGRGGFNLEEAVRASGKLAALDDVLPKLKATGHRVLLFSQMTKALDIVGAYLTASGYAHLRLDGSTKTEDRARLLAEFNAPGSPHFLFLLSTRAGGLGLNLQTADTVIMFDSDWNPAADAQAEDRAHRIGQTRDVLVLVLAAAGTIEEAVLDRAASKRALDAKVIQAGMFNDASTHGQRTHALQALLAAGTSGVGSGVMSRAALNRALARSPAEGRTFAKMDAARDAARGGKPPLMTEEDVPEWARDLVGGASDGEEGGPAPGESEDSDPEGTAARGGRRRRRRAAALGRGAYSERAADAAFEELIASGESDQGDDDEDGGPDDTGDDGSDDATTTTSGGGTPGESASEGEEDEDEGASPPPPPPRPPSRGGRPPSSRGGGGGGGSGRSRSATVDVEQRPAKRLTRGGSGGGGGRRSLSGAAPGPSPPGTGRAGRVTRRTSK